MIVDLAAFAPRIGQWTGMAARSFGSYLGINAAIGAAPKKYLPIVHHAHDIGQDLVLLAAIRIFAVLDRGAEVGLQKAYRFLKEDFALEHVVELYSGDDPPSFRNSAERTCKDSIERFLTEYRQIDWVAFSRLQRFRNGAIAHLSHAEFESALTYSQFEEMVRRCARLSGELTLMTSGKNDWPEERLRDASDDARRYWEAIFAAAAEETVEHYLVQENG